MQKNNKFMATGKSVSKDTEDYICHNKKYHFTKGIIWGAIVSACAIFLYFAWITWGVILIGVVPKSEVTNILKDFEEYYLYKDDVIYNDNYIKEKTVLLNKPIVFKSEIKKLVDIARTEAEDEFTYFGYDDLQYNAYSIIKDVPPKFISSIKEDKYLYISFNTFAKPVANQFIEALEKNKNKEYLIIDLRNNGGGSEQEVVKICDSLLDNVEIFGVRVAMEPKTPLRLLYNGK